MKHKFLLGLFVFVGGFASAMVLPRVATGISDLVISGNGSAMQFAATNIISNLTTCTNSTTFVDIPGMQQAFTENRPGGALTFFQGRWYSDLAGLASRVVIRHLVDGAPVDGESPVAWTIQNGTLAGPVQISGTSGMNFLDNDLASGPHTVKIQWSVLAPGQHVCVGRRTVIVLHG
jgi:hypothetical protein